MNTEKEKEEPSFKRQRLEANSDDESEFDAPVRTTKNESGIHVHEGVEHVQLISNGLEDASYDIKKTDTNSASFRANQSIKPSRRVQVDSSKIMPKPMPPPQAVLLKKDTPKLTLNNTQTVHSVSNIKELFPQFKGSANRRVFVVKPITSGGNRNPILNSKEETKNRSIVLKTVSTSVPNAFSVKTPIVFTNALTTLPSVVAHTAGIPTGPFALISKDRYTCAFPNSSDFPTHIPDASSIQCGLQNTFNMTSFLPIKDVDDIKVITNTLHVTEMNKNERDKQKWVNDKSRENKDIAETNIIVNVLLEQWERYLSMPMEDMKKIALQQARSLKYTDTFIELIEETMDDIEILSKQYCLYDISVDDINIHVFDTFVEDRGNTIATDVNKQEVSSKKSI
ncbi:unnamed protein product [Owenia fusiformis]|uniref:Uncharacterized protein n=1 Tax=Owenia fusiformis TaxID=6347 RepID=A0A8J1Y9Y4_OWEFU|nr:unnamed protein product [Owenia fusiformis]